MGKDFKMRNENPENQRRAPLRCVNARSISTACYVRDLKAGGSNPLTPTMHRIPSVFEACIGTHADLQIVTNQ